MRLAERVRELADLGLELRLSTGRPATVLRRRQTGPAAFEELVLSLTDRRL